MNLNWKQASLAACIGLGACGVQQPKGLTVNGPDYQPLLTPTTQDPNNKDKAAWIMAEGVPANLFARGGIITTETAVPTSQVCGPVGTTVRRTEGTEDVDPPPSHPHHKITTRTETITVYAGKAPEEAGRNCIDARNFQPAGAIATPSVAEQVAEPVAGFLGAAGDALNGALRKPNKQVTNNNNTNTPTQSQGATQTGPTVTGPTVTQTQTGPAVTQTGPTVMQTGPTVTQTGPTAIAVDPGQRPDGRRGQRDYQPSW